MTESQSTTCPRCGASGSGNFCASCGAMLTTPPCAACGAKPSPGARFCHVCGTAVAGASAPTGAPTPSAATPQSSDRTPWLVALILIVAIVAVVGYSASKRNAPAAPDMTNAGNAGGNAPTVRAPSIDSLSPKERFIRLQTRIDQQMERNDTTRLAFFIEMAIGAYGMLADSDRDVDTRFHAAMLQTEAGNLPAARALTDTIMKQSPDNLLAYYVRAIAAEAAGDSAQAKAARVAFRSHFDAEMKKKRPEYEEHRPFLEQYIKSGGAN